MAVKNHTDPHSFYQQVLGLFKKNSLSFMLGGAFAFGEYTGIKRDTKDLDIFCKAGDYPRMLQILQEEGYKTEITDARWLAKAFYNNYYVDLIFASANGQCPVDDTWLTYAKSMNIFDTDLMAIAPEEMIWSKSYVQDKLRFDGADINHLILKTGKNLDWTRLLMRMEPHWEILFSHIINFRFVYPSERNSIPQWIIEELCERMTHQLTLPIPKDKVCRGSLLSRSQYQIDVKEWEFNEIA